ncbi:protein SOB FIVE-LIKE 3 [Brassica napus]|nr:protein SOB FIVE-LIKE 3 [Brassica napus]
MKTQGSSSTHMQLYIYIYGPLHKQNATTRQNKNSHKHSLSFETRVLELSMEREECSSSESGWTTYISSPMEDDEEEVTDEVYYEGHITGNDKRKHVNDYENNKDSDDSMASDASSGPSYPQTSNRGRSRECIVLRNGKSESKSKSNEDYDHKHNAKNSGNYKCRIQEKKKSESKSKHFKKK